MGQFGFIFPALQVSLLSTIPKFTKTILKVVRKVKDLIYYNIFLTYFQLFGDYFMKSQILSHVMQLCTWILPLEQHSIHFKKSRLFPLAYISLYLFLIVIQNFKAYFFIYDFSVMVSILWQIFIYRNFHRKILASFQNVWASFLLIQKGQNRKS